MTFTDVRVLEFCNTCWKKKVPVMQVSQRPPTQASLFCWNQVLFVLFVFLEEVSSDEEKDMTFCASKVCREVHRRLRDRLLKILLALARRYYKHYYYLYNFSLFSRSVIIILSKKQLILNAELNLLLNRQRPFIHHLIDDSAHREDAADAGAYLG